MRLDNFWTKIEECNGRIGDVHSGHVCSSVSSSLRQGRQKVWLQAVVMGSEKYLLQIWHVRLLVIWNKIIKSFGGKRGLIMDVGGRFNGCGMRELWDIGWGRRKISGFIQN